MCRRPITFVRTAAWFYASLTVWTMHAAPSVAAEPSVAKRSKSLKYPETLRDESIADDYHGTRVSDPYRWLEDPNSSQTQDWIKRQNELTFGYLKEIPGRERIEKRLTRLWNYERFSVPTQRGGRYFYSRNDGLQNQAVLLVADSLAAKPRVLLDPNTLADDGTAAISGLAISDDGKLLAYGIASAGSDWQEWRVRDVDTGKDRDDHLRWVKFSGASWTNDNLGFYYSRYDEPAEGTTYTGANYFQKLYYHRLGTPQTQDRLVYERPDEKKWGFDGDVTEDGRYLIVSVRRGADRKNQVFYQDLTTSGAPIAELIVGFDALYSFVGNDGPVFWFLTDSGAPRSRVIAVDTRSAARENWRELIPEGKDTLRDVNLVGDRFFALQLHDASSRIAMYGLDGKSLGEVPLPGLGTASGFTGRRGDRETFYSYTSYTEPAAVYRYDLATGQSSVFRRPKVDFDGEKYETIQVRYTSKDGTSLPMFIIGRKGAAKNKRTPTMLYGYGGFGASLTPSFAVARAVWLEMGGLYAVPNLRGGGEYGSAWHEAGKRKNKQNVFDDFIGAAEFLIKEGYTSPERLAIAGHSNGGLLVGACLTQRPALFGATLPGVGVMDMLRFHKFTIGWAWVPEYGSAEENDMFATLLAYSPLHNLKSGTRYPATLVTTADHDDRVVPAHSFKFAAAMQAAQTSTAPVLIRVETRAGHGAGTPTSKAIEETADELAFLTRALEMPEPR